MPWFKVDDGFWSHPKTLQLSDGAIALWLRAGSWSMHHLTDGFIPNTALRMLDAKPRFVSELVSVSLWIRSDSDLDSEKSGKPAYQFHDWATYQPTREQVEAERRDAAERKRKSREKSRRDSHVTDTGVTEGVTPTPTRPDPTRPIEEDKSSSKARETKLPDDWMPTAEHAKRAKDRGIDVMAEAENFRLHAEANDRRAVKWNAAFTMWLNKAKPGKPKANPDWWMK